MHWIRLCFLTDFFVKENIMKQDQEYQSNCIVKLLVVDDERIILKSIKRGFFASGFDVFTASNGEEGLDILKTEDIDIVISDYRMPVMDGLEFLRIVKKEYPAISRIILSSLVEHSAIVKSLTRGLASTYFPKPWDNEVIEKRINHILQLRRILRGKKILGLVNSIDKLPVLPSIYQNFMEAIDAEKSIKEISKILMNDPAISVKVLQIANSAFYGLSESASIEQAISYLGLTLIKDIVLTISVTTNMSWTKYQLDQIQDIFHHSSMVNKFIPKLYNIRYSNKKKQFPSVGLTHDIGKIILLQYFPERYKKIMEMMKENPDMSFYSCELALGFRENTHSEIGAYFLNWWNLPEIITEVALFHHNPEKCGENYKTFLEISALVNNLVNYLIANIDKEDIDISRFHLNYLSNESIATIADDIRRDINAK